MSADTSLILGVRSLARLAGVPRSRVNAAMDAGQLVTVATTALRGRTCRYVLVTGDGALALDRWAERHASPLYLADVEVPRTNGGHRWFYPADVRRASADPACGFSLDARERLAPTGAWLRWAASFMPDGERQAVLGALVEAA